MSNRVQPVLDGPRYRARPVESPMGEAQRKLRRHRGETIVISTATLDALHGLACAVIEAQASKGRLGISDAWHNACITQMIDIAMGDA